VGVAVSDSAEAGDSLAATVLVIDSEGVVGPATLDDLGDLEDSDESVGSVDSDDPVQLLEDAPPGELGKMVMTENGPVAPGSKGLELVDVRSLVVNVVHVVSRDDVQGQRVTSDG